MSGYLDLTNYDHLIAEHHRRTERVTRTAWMFETGAGEPRMTPTEPFSEALRRVAIPVAAATTAIATLAMLVR